MGDREGGEWKAVSSGKEQIFSGPPPQPLMSLLHGDGSDREQNKVQQIQIHANNIPQSDIHANTGYPMYQTLLPQPKLSSCFIELENVIDQRKFGCSWPGCSKTFFRKTDVTRHYRIHVNDRPYRCTWPDCGKAFMQRSAVKIHFRTHTGEKPNVCPFEGCDKSFNDTSSLARHRRTHRLLDPFPCSDKSCSEYFATRKLLIEHEKVVHGIMPQKKSCPVKRPKFAHDNAANLPTPLVTPESTPARDLLSFHSQDQHRDDQNMAASASKPFPNSASNDSNFEKLSLLNSSFLQFGEMRQNRSLGPSLQPFRLLNNPNFVSNDLFSNANTEFRFPSPSHDIFQQPRQPSFPPNNMINSLHGNSASSIPFPNSSSFENHGLSVLLSSHPTSADGTLPFNPFPNVHHQQQQVRVDQSLNHFRQSNDRDPAPPLLSMLRTTSQRGMKPPPIDTNVHTFSEFSRELSDRHPGVVQSARDGQSEPNIHQPAAPRTADALTEYFSRFNYE